MSRFNGWYLFSLKFASGRISQTDGKDKEQQCVKFDTGVDWGSRLGENVETNARLFQVA